MKIAKPILLVITPVGVAGALYEAYRFGGGLVILLIALLSLVSVAMLSVVLTIRKERKAEQEKSRTANSSS
jgi:hypothetical protein